ncbi:zinc finger MYM-type protein 1-like [Latimeria chalumnae]|uniref:zinc finger MYM-type protein 1-like n=1 Tax=Latimeria chalumnae TaxID=7897 RepID=UPI00313AE0F3
MSRQGEEAVGPPTKRQKLMQSKLNFGTLRSPSSSNARSDTGCSTVPTYSAGDNATDQSTTRPTSPRDLQGAPDVDSSRIECNEVCCGIADSGKRIQLIVPKKDTVRVYGKGEKARERYFNFEWYKNREWLVLCKTQMRAYCAVCRFAVTKQMVTFSKCGDEGFVKVGINNWKNCPANLDSHEKSHFHRECLLKRSAYLKQVPVHAQIVHQKTTDQEKNQRCLLEQLRCLQFLVRQGIAVRGHTVEESNFQNLVQLVSHNNPELQTFMKNRKYISHDIINELIKEMYRECLNNLLSQIKAAEFYSIVVDETRDVAGHEQLSFSVRWVSQDYVVHEDFIGMHDCPKTDAESIFLTIKDILVRCGLDMDCMRGQTYDGASVLQGQMSGVAKRIKDVNPKAVSVHCMNHSLNLILQEAGSKCAMIRSALSLLHDLHEIINSSPKRLALFESIRASYSSQSDRFHSLKPLCPTRWTARSQAIESVLCNYEAIYDTLEELIATGGNTEAAKKAPGLQALMTCFDLFLGLKVSFKIFSAAEEVARVLQSKDITLETVNSTVEMLRTHLTKMRGSEQFHTIFEDAQQTGTGLIEAPAIPRRRRAPHHYDDGIEPHQWTTPEDYFRSQFFELIDLLTTVINRRFDQPTLLLLMSIEKILITAINGLPCSQIPEKIVDTYSGNIAFDRLLIQLAMLPDLLKTHNKSSTMCITNVTKIGTIIEILTERPEMCSLFSQVDILLRLYLTVPMSNATAERSFSCLRRMKTYLRSSMTEKRLNHLLFLHIHKHLTDSMDLKNVMHNFCFTSARRSQYFGK